MSIDYKIGDKFRDKHGDIAIFFRDDGTELPFFSIRGRREWAVFWEELTPIKEKNNKTLAQQVRNIRKQLNAVLKELES